MLSTLFVVTLAMGRCDPSALVLLQKKASAMSPLASWSSHAHGELVCREGRWLPELFLIGTQKAASSSIAHDLISFGVKPLVLNSSEDQTRECYESRRCNWKEFHFFDNQFSQLRQDGKSVEDVSNFWPAFLDQLPACPTSGLADVGLLADLTPANAPLVPKPDNQSPCANCSSEVNLPKLLASMYGNQANNLRFAVTLRSPIARMQSAWYVAKASDFTRICFDCKAESFSHALQAAVDDLGKTPPKYQEWVWRSMLSLHLNEWLKYFDAEQFVVIPFWHTKEEDGTEAASIQLCRSLELNFKRNLQCRLSQNAPTHLNEHKHPELRDEGIPDTLLSEYNAAMDVEKQRLVTLLAQMHENGATLLGLDSEPVDAHEIESWLGWEYAQEESLLAVATLEQSKRQRQIERKREMDGESKS
eukprot:TRINITY_DN1339_c0_g1_i4.p1 TRINITY_DN1339_c0_g1~~TRINITY_DN1339_c0_g1_i4.p1  ORF type:complete len:418 (+),score=43.96 TRINITY_DN1339_c0_g1_i4:45-1298(+)